MIFVLGMMPGEGYGVVIIKPIKPSISVSASTANVDQPIYITGYDFNSSGSPMTIYWGDGDSLSWTFQNNGFNAAHDYHIEGIYTIKAVDSIGEQATGASLSIFPTISVTPSTITAGDTVQITGKGYGHDQQVSIVADFGDGSNARSIGTTQSNDAGDISYSAKIQQPGNLKIWGQDNPYISSDDAYLTVNKAPIVTPKQIVTPTQTVTPGQSPGTPTPPISVAASGNDNGAPSSTSDSVAPVTTLALNGTGDGNGTFSSDVTCTLNATDNDTGVNVIQYSFDGSTWYTYTKPFSIVKPGMTAIYYRSTDNTGNTEVANVKAIVITAPSSSPAATSTAKPTPSPSMGAAAMALIGMAALLLLVRRTGKN